VRLPGPRNTLCGAPSSGCTEPARDSSANAINDSGVVVGAIPGNLSNFVFSQPVKWDLNKQGEATVLPLPDYGTCCNLITGIAHGINAQGDVVGVVFVKEPGSLGAANGYALLWRASGGAPIVLDKGEGALQAEAWAINDHGVIVGTASRPGAILFPGDTGNTAVKWSAAGEFSRLHDLTQPNSEARAINGSGTILGQQGSRAVQF